MSDIVERLEECIRCEPILKALQVLQDSVAEIVQLRAQLEIKTSEAQSMRETSIQHCRERNKAERELAEARDKALDEAAESVCGYIHPAYGKLPGDPFATAVVRALKSPKPPIL